MATLSPGPAPAGWLRAGYSLLLVILALLPMTLGRPNPVLAAEPIVRDHRAPVARVQLVIKRVIVHDDFDWGSGEIAITTLVYTPGGGCPSADSTACRTLLVKSGVPEFSATNGSVQHVDQVVPSATDVVLSPAISPAFGIPVQNDTPLKIAFLGAERDPSNDDVIGEVVEFISDGQGQIRLGNHTVRANGHCESVPVFPSFCSASPGGFSVEYEVRPAPVPDLRPVGIKTHDLLGTTRKLVCMAVVNSELFDAGPFEVALMVDGVVPPDGRATAGRLAAGGSAELCVEAELPPTGQHTLTAVVDESRSLVEFNETNNLLEMAYQGQGATTTATDQSRPSVVPATASPAPSGMRPDLTVSAIKVNGQVPDSKADCKDGKNTVTVVVKNGGSGTADGFSVRLAVDGSAAEDVKVSGLQAGKEREIRFDDVRLKQGEHDLEVTVDASETVDEANEGNNTRDVTARCSDGR